MDIWEDVTKKINEAAAYTAHEAEKLTGVAKLKYKLMNLRSKESDLYEKIGRLHYSELRDIPEQDGTVNHAPEIAELAAELDTVKADIKAAEDELMNVKNQTLCVKCGAKIEREMIFCPKCGARQDKDGEDKTDGGDETK